MHTRTHAGPACWNPMNRGVAHRSACPPSLVSSQDAVPTASPATGSLMAEIYKNGPVEGLLCVLRLPAGSQVWCVSPSPTNGTREAGMGSWLAGRPGGALGLQQCRMPLATLSAPTHPPSPWPTPLLPKASPTFCSFWAHGPISPAPSLPQHMRRFPCLH